MNLICYLQAFIHISCSFLYPNKPSYGMADFSNKAVFQGYFSPTSMLLPGVLSPPQLLSLSEWVTFWIKPVPSGSSQELMLLINYGVFVLDACCCCCLYVCLFGWVFFLFWLVFFKPSWRPVAFFYSKQWAKSWIFLPTRCFVGSCIHQPCSSTCFMYIIPATLSRGQVLLWTSFRQEHPCVVCFSAVFTH